MRYKYESDEFKLIVFSINDEKISYRRERIVNGKIQALTISSKHFKDFDNRDFFLYNKNKYYIDEMEQI